MFQAASDMLHALEGLQRVRHAAALLAALTTVMIAGCTERGPRVVEVTGSVTRGGKPVANLLLNFKPDNGRPSWALTDAEGKYSLKYSRHQDGAIVGTHTVWVRYKPGGLDEEMDILSGKRTPSKDIAAMLEKYGSEHTTPLKFEIGKDHQVVDISLD